MFPAIYAQSYDCSESCTAVRGVAESVKQMTHIGLRVMVSTGRIAGAVYSRLTAERYHFQARIVGKAIYTVVLHYIAGLLKSVGFKCIACLGQIFYAPYVSERLYFKVAAGYGTQLGELVDIVGSKNYCLGHIFTF